MKSQPTSAINKISDLNSVTIYEVVKINKKMQMIEASHDKLSSSLKDEINMRENIERKIFQMNESFNNKFSVMQKGIEDFSGIITEQINEVKTKLLDQVGNNHKNTNKSIEELVKKYEIIEKENINIINDHKAFKMEANDKLLSLDENTNKSLNLYKKEILDTLSKIELIEKKIQENISFQNKEIQSLLQDNNHLKNSIEILHKFKENISFNFSDVTEEINRIDETSNDFRKKIILSLQENDLKLKNFEQTLSIETDKLISAKKDIYSQLYDYNLNMSNKFDVINENVLNKFESMEKNFKTFKLGLIEENEKFSQYLMEQHENSQGNMRKLLDYHSEEVKLLSEKTGNLEDLLKNIRNEFYNNLNELENYTNKKYESLFKNYTQNLNNSFRYN